MVGSADNLAWFVLWYRDERSGCVFPVEISPAYKDSGQLHNPRSQSEHRNSLIECSLCPERHSRQWTYRVAWRKSGSRGVFVWFLSLVQRMRNSDLFGSNRQLPPLLEGRRLVG